MNMKAVLENFQELVPPEKMQIFRLSEAGMKAGGLSQGSVLPVPGTQVWRRAGL